MPDTTTTLQPYTEGALLALADLLERQPEGAWDRPSLCDAWRVREVVAHMTAAARYGPDAFMAEVGADGGDLGRTVDRLAARDGQRSPDALLADLRSPRLHRWEPPGGGERGALAHAVIHGFDVAVALGLDFPLPPEAVRPVLDDLAAGGHAHFGVALDGVALRATDLDWSHGEGRPVAGRAADLVLLLSGRRPGDGRIDGALA
jgi:uncharacterized protein (TIGR03083 family)